MFFRVKWSSQHECESANPRKNRNVGAVWTFPYRRFGGQYGTCGRVDKRPDSHLLHYLFALLTRPQRWNLTKVFNQVALP